MLVCGHENIIGDILLERGCGDTQPTIPSFNGAYITRHRRFRSSLKSV
jgi:hypothetical protein